MSNYRIDGTAARVPEYRHEDSRQMPVRRRSVLTQKRRRHSASAGAPVRKRYASARRMTAGFVAFLTVMICISMAACISYLNLKEMITTQTNQNEKLAVRLNSLKSENDALLENVNNSIDWTYIRDTAINEFGMKYATEDQIVWYHTDGNRYIRQYEEIPSDRG